VRTIIALARWNGLRIPSEIRDLRWRDIDWEKRRMIIRSPKLARYEDKAERCVAIFPEAFVFLQELRRLRPEASEDDNIFSEDVYPSQQLAYVHRLPLPGRRDKTMAEVVYQPASKPRQ
jgi:integrase